MGLPACVKLGIVRNVVVALGEEAERSFTVITLSAYVPLISTYSDRIYDIGHLAILTS